MAPSIVEDVAVEDVAVEDVAVEDMAVEDVAGGMPLPGPDVRSKTRLLTLLLDLRVYSACE
jgi:hypothetical protein